MTDNSHSSGLAVRSRSVRFWITMARAVLASLLGLALILQPDKARPRLVTFMGMFWLVSGIMSLRWSAAGERAGRSAQIAGAVGILAGGIVLARQLIRDYVPEATLIYLLGSVMFLTGITHMSGTLRTGSEDRRNWSWSHFALGLFESVLGAQLLISPLDVRRGVYWAATIWAFVGAFILLTEALRTRARERNQGP